MNEKTFSRIMLILALITAIGCVLMLSYLVIQNKFVLICGTLVMLCGIMGIVMGAITIVGEVFT